MAKEKYSIHVETPAAAEPTSLNGEDIESKSGDVYLVLEGSAEIDGPGAFNALGLKLAKDGRTILIPQPSDGPQDPLNWSSFKKHILLLCAAFAAFAGEFGCTAGVPAVVIQGQEWNMSPLAVNDANSLAVAMIALQSVLWMPLLNCWGRMPVLFWSTVLAMLFTLGCALSQDFSTYYGMRALTTVFQTTGQVIGLVLIEDMFFFHEQARKIGIWFTIFICAPYLSPALGNFIVAGLGEWRPIFWLLFTWAACTATMIVTFGDETYYNRTLPVETQPNRKGGQLARLSRASGIWAIRERHHYRPNIFRAYGRLLETLVKPVVFSTVVIYSIIFMWGIGINLSSAILLQTPREAGGYGLGPKAIGGVFFTAVVSVFIAEVIGHFLNDWIVRVYTRRHHGTFVPEARLWTTYLGALMMIPGLILTGQTLQHRLPYVGVIFGWGMHTVGLMLASVAIYAYLLDCYPNASGEVSALINGGRAIAGFGVSYFEMSWGLKQGFDVSFGLQAVITAFGIFLVVLIQIYGARVRRWAGPVKAI